MEVAANITKSLSPGGGALVDLLYPKTCVDGLITSVSLTSKNVMSRKEKWRREFHGLTVGEDIPDQFIFFFFVVRHH